MPLCTYDIGLLAEADLLAYVVRRLFSDRKPPISILKNMPAEARISLTKSFKTIS
jgi:hypothetical protein